MGDVLQKIGNSLVQHGPHSDRVYAMKLDSGDMPGILEELEGLARQEGYGKIFAKTRRSQAEDLLRIGFVQEAAVPRFFGPGQDGVFMGKFLDPARSRDSRWERVKEVLRVARKERENASPEGSSFEGSGVSSIGSDAGAPGSSTKINSPAGDPEPVVREAAPGDLGALADCYAEVFESYPFPIHDPFHLEEEREAGTRYFAAWEGSELIAASSMEPGGAPGTVEMTDFATLPDHRGKGLATRLLGHMDRAAARSGVRVAYTIARALSFGMNITFARRAYDFGGTLVNNTQISGHIESMNVWYKLMATTPTTTNPS